jgi:hypothetical protein
MIRYILEGKSKKVIGEDIVILPIWLVSIL